MMMTETMTGMTEPVRLRHEVKHQISPQEDLVLTSRLKKLFPRDGHAGPDGSYRVTSLYFDTPYDTALREKLDGVDRREKFRLRYYGEIPAFLKLEKKFKVNGLCGKRSARLTAEEGGRLLAGDSAFLLGRGSRCWWNCTINCGGRCCGPGPWYVTIGRRSCTPLETSGSPWIEISAPARTVPVS